MGEHNKEGEYRAVEGALGAVSPANSNNGLREGYQPGFQNQPPIGCQGETYGQNSLPRIEIERNSRMPAGDLLRSGGEDHVRALADLQHPSHRPSRFYQEFLRQLSRDVSEQSRNQEKLDMGPGYNGRPDLQIVPNNQPFYEGRRPGTSLPPAPDNYYNNQGPARWKR